MTVSIKRMWVWSVCEYGCMVICGYRAYAVMGVDCGVDVVQFRHPCMIRV